MTKVDVIIPFTDLHELFPKDIARDMRDFSHFTQFLKSWTVLHIFQRPCLTIGDKDYIISNNYDVLCCYQIFKELIESTRTGTEKRILKFYRDFMMGNEETLYVSTLTAAYNEKNKSKLSDFTIRKWLNRLNQIGYVEKQEDDNDKRKYIYVPLIEENIEKPENNYDLEKQTKILSILEKSFNSWKKIICEQKGVNIKENIFSKKIVCVDCLKNYTLLNVQKLLSLTGNVFKYFDTPKQNQILENNPKNICVSKKKAIATIPKGQLPNCFSCHKPIIRLTSLTNIDGKPIHKKCKLDIEAQKKKSDWKCPELDTLDDRPFCNVISSFLAKPEDCSKDCSLLEEIGT